MKLECTYLGITNIPYMKKKSKIKKITTYLDFIIYSTRFFFLLPDTTSRQIVFLVLSSTLSTLLVDVVFQLAREPYLTLLATWVAKGGVFIITNYRTCDLSRNFLLFQRVGCNIDDWYEYSCFTLKRHI